MASNHSLDLMVGKTIKSVDYGNSDIVTGIDEVTITFTDGTVLKLTGEYIGHGCAIIEGEVVHKGQ